MKIGFFKLIILLVSLCIADVVNAQSQTSVLALENENFLNKAKPQYNLGISLLGINYFSTSVADASFQQQVELDGQFKVRSGLYHFVGEGLLGSRSESQSHYQAIPELYVAYGDLNGHFLFVGRKKILFSALDENEHLSLYQSVFTNDFINFKNQGLIGLGGQLSNGYVGVVGGFFSNYLPNQVPQVYIDNGKVESSNRWANRPPPQFSFLDKNREIIYAVRDYSVWDIMNSPGYAVSTFFNPTQMVASDRPFIKLSYAHLPINDIPLARETYGNIQLVGQVLLSPVVTYHEVQSIDINLGKSELLQTTLSYIQDQPSNKVASDGETLQHLTPLQAAGLQVKSNLNKIINRRVIASVQYTEIYGGGIQDLQSNGQLGTFNFSSRRTRFQRPITFGASTEFEIAARPSTAELKWTYYFSDKGSLLSGVMGVSVWKDLALNFGFDLLGVENDDPDNQSFLQQNQANDRIYGGLNYVF